MSTIADMRSLTGADATSAAAYAQAVRDFNLVSGDPVARIEATIRERPGFVMAHALKAWLYLLGTEPAGIAAARDAYDAAKDLPMSRHERGHFAAIGQILDGRWHAASRVVEDVTLEHPRDILALQAGHQIDFLTGNARMLRDRIARVLPAWSPTMPGYHAVLGMHAFGLEECGDYAAAEASGRAAVALEPRDGWAQHAVAHVLEMQGRHDDGIRWMRVNPAAWSTDSFMAVHNWWHLALYHLDLEQIDEVLELFDGPIHGARSTMMMDMIDAAAMLWRLMLRGVDVGDRWESVANGFAPIAGAGNYAFNQVHAMMAFVGAGRRDLAAVVLESQKASVARDDDNARFTSEVGQPLAKAILAFGDGNYAETARLIRPVRHIAHRFGGSHAQRDIFDLTLIEAAFRAGDAALAKALAAERVAVKPTSPLAQLFARRAGLRQAAG